MTGQWFSPGTPVSSTNKTDRHDKPEWWNDSVFTAIAVNRWFEHQSSQVKPWTIELVFATTPLSTHYKQ